MSLVWYLSYFWRYSLIYFGPNDLNPYLHLALYIFDWIFFILSCNKDNHKSLDEFEIQQDLTRDLFLNGSSSVLQVALVKTSKCENLVLYFSEKFRKIAAFAMLFWFSVTKQSFENGFGFPQWSEIPTLPASLKIRRHFSTTTAFDNSVLF